MLIRRTAWNRWGAVVIGAGLFGAGCSMPLAPPARTGEPVGVQLMRTEPAFTGTPFRVLLDFESPNDLAFIAGPARVKLDPEVAHTGNASLQVPADVGGFSVKLASMMAGAEFPGSWTLIGGYFISREQASVQVSYAVHGKVLLRRNVVLAARKWTPVFLDLGPLSDPNGSPSHEIGVLAFTSNALVWCDDVMVQDNVSLLAGESDKAGDGWAVRRRGFVTLIEKPGAFKLSIPSPEADPDGWRIEEANDLRVMAKSPDGKRFWTIYSDGRAYLGGKLQAVIEMPETQRATLEEQQASPAEMSVAEELGRVERNAPGDRNNDGYAEMTGAYQLKAHGPRFEVTITPRTPKLWHPVLEIAGLPRGRVVATVEGRLIDKAVRLENGHVLIEVPSVLNRPVTLNVRIQ